MGCDEAVLVQPPNSLENAGYLDVARYAGFLTAALREMEWDAIIAGCHAADADAIPASFLIAEQLGLAAAWNIEELTLGENGVFLARQTDGSMLRTLELTPPCLILALPDPKKRIYRTVDGISKAYAMDIPVLSVGGEPDISVQMVSSKADQPKASRRLGRMMEAPVEEVVPAVMDLLVRHGVLGRI